MKNSLIRIWKEKGRIFSGIKNSIFTKDHIEEIASYRKDICNSCEHIDTKGDKCMVPGTGPCCGLCGCSLKFKLRSLSSACDVNNWGAEMSQEEQDKLYLSINYNPEK